MNGSKLEARLTLPETLFLQESDEIEGIHKVPSLYFYKNRKDADSYVEQHVAAFERVKDVPPLTIDFVLELHGILMQNLLPYPGALRTVLVRVGDQIPPGPAAVPYLLDDWVHRVNDGILHDPLAAHCEFERIHPFLDGNGRTGRLLWAWQRLGQNLPVRPILTEFDDSLFNLKRHCYYESIRNYRKGPL